MIELINELEKRRFKAFIAVIIIGLIAIVVSFSVSISPLNYFGGEYNYFMIYALLLYKVVELLILYYLLMYRYIVTLQKIALNDELLLKIRKHTKLLFFLIPQGNTIFGIIAYKLSGEIKFFLIFSLIALITLFITKPNRLNVTLKSA